MSADLATTELEFDMITVKEDGQINERQTLRARQFAEILDNGLQLDLVFIPGGTFLMGSAARRAPQDEGPPQG